MTGQIDERRQTPDLAARRDAPGRRNPVVAPALIVGFRIGAFVEFLDQAVVEHALDRSIQRAGPEPDAAASLFPDGAKDGVPVLIGAGERHENVKDRRRKRTGIYIHRGYIRRRGSVLVGLPNRCYCRRTPQPAMSVLFRP